MLLKLTEWLTLIDPSFRVFQYLTLRAILGVLTALAISFLVGPTMIRRLGSLQIGQTVRDDGPQSHLSKAGTPTMGGALILVAIFLSTFFWANLDNRFIWVVLITTVLFGVVGWVDDYRKLVRGDSRGLRAREKYLWQSLIALGSALFIYLSANTAAETQLLIPMFKSLHIEIGLAFCAVRLCGHRRFQ